MSTETKIAKLKQALKAGDILTPERAYRRFHMAHNTYHRSIYALRHHEGLPIRAHITVERNGVRHSIHWLEGSTHADPR